MSEQMVYLIEQPETGHTKIGISNDPYGRCRELQNSTPLLIVLNCLLAHPAVSAATVEKALHRHFKSDRIYGEWFRLTADEILGDLTKHPDDQILGQIEVVYRFTHNPELNYHQRQKPPIVSAQSEAHTKNAWEMFRYFSIFMALADISLLGAATGLMPLSLYEFVCYLIINVASAGGMVSLAFSRSGVHESEPLAAPVSVHSNGNGHTREDER